MSSCSNPALSARAPLLIGDALGVSKQAAWKSYNEDVRELLDDVRQRSGLSDEEAQRLADDERAARAVRRRSSSDPNVLISAVVASGVSAPICSTGG